MKAIWVANIEPLLWQGLLGWNSGGKWQPLPLIVVDWNVF